MTFDEWPLGRRFRLSSYPIAISALATAVS